ncbi:MAG TPA: hypothetical protein VGI65_13135 [Steroidobacteraceae bacterium]|jgi:hypothetical protein
MYPAGPAIARLAKAGLAIILSLLAACANHASDAAKSSAGKAPPRVVRSGARQLINFYSSIAPNCESNGYPQVALFIPPRHGQVSIERGENYPNFVRANVRSACNQTLSPSIQVYYRSVANFHGTDAFSVRIQYPDGGFLTDTFNLDAR